MIEWRTDIENAPTDGRQVLIYAAIKNPDQWHECMRDLEPFVCAARYHEDAGWCVCEIREATHWAEINTPEEAK